MLTFPELSRKPALKTRGSTLDPTLRDSYENGMENSRARFTRLRDEWAVSIDALTPGDVQALQDFVKKQAIGGANIFSIDDVRDPHNPKQYFVRFSTLPSYTDAGNIEDEFRQNCTFTVREV